MKTERQRLIKPITIVKVKKFLESIIGLIDNSVKFSLQSSAKEHNISNNIATILIKNKMVKIGDGAIPVFYSERFDATKETAVKLIEADRVYKKKNAHQKALQDSQEQSGGEMPIKIDLSSVKNDSNQKDIQTDELNLKSLKKPEMQSMIEKAFASVQQPKQTDIFDGINNTYKERFELVKSIASGIYSKIDYEGFSKELTSKVNEDIVFIAADLHEKLIAYKKPKQGNE